MNYSLLYKGFKEFYSNIVLQNNIERFNKKNNNDIRSKMIDLRAIAGQYITALEGSYACSESKIGSYSFIGFNTLISKTTIGRYNSIASNVNIGHGEHPIDRISTHSNFIEDTFNALTLNDCVIEHDVWLGAGSIIRRGVTVGTGAVVGANSFVNITVPPFSIVVGSPARILKYRFSEKKIKQILESHWWELDINEAKERIKELEINTSVF